MNKDYLEKFMASTGGMTLVCVMHTTYGVSYMLCAIYTKLSIVTYAL